MLTDKERKERKAISNRKHWDANKEHYDLYAKKWCADNRDKRRVYSKTYRDKNKEKIKISKREWVNNNKEKVKIYRKSYRIKNIDKEREYNRNGIESLSDRYVIANILHGSSLTTAEIREHPELIELRRELIKTRRYIRENE